MSKNQKEGAGAIKKHIDSKDVEIPLCAKAKRILRIKDVLVSAKRRTKMIKDDLVQDMIEVLTSFCARLYGRRWARNRAKKAMEVIENVGK